MDFSLIIVFRNMGVLQTTVAEIVTVKEHQRTSSEPAKGSIQAHMI